jgi:hypothetical protein
MAMKDKQVQSLLEIAITPRLVSLIMERRAVDYKKAFSILLNSKIYRALEDEDTGVWHLSYETLYTLLTEELSTGTITWPEEQS